MSTLQVTNIKKTGETASRDVSGVAAAWVKYKTATTTAITGSFGVSSLTDNGAGDTTINTPAAFTSADDLIGTFSSNNYHVIQSGVATSSSIRVLTLGINHTPADTAKIYVVMHGDLA